MGEAKNDGALEGQGARYSGAAGRAFIGGHEAPRNHFEPASARAAHLPRFLRRDGGRTFVVFPDLHRVRRRVFGRRWQPAAARAMHPAKSRLCGYLGGGCTVVDAADRDRNAAATRSVACVRDRLRRVRRRMCRARGGPRALRHLCGGLSGVPGMLQPHAR